MLAHMGEKKPRPACNEEADAHENATIAFYGVGSVLG